MTKNYFIAVLLLIYCFVLSFQPLSLFACWISIIPSSEGRVSWTYGNDAAEQSFINYENGIEKLIISRTFDNKDKNTVWVIPISSPPESVKVNVLPETPKLRGYNVKDEVNNTLIKLHKYSAFTQEYLLLPKIIRYLSGEDYGNSHYSGFSNSTDKLMTNSIVWAVWDSPEEVLVYEHLEKEWMVVEVLSATNSDALYVYLKNKWLNVNKDSIDILQGYIGKKFSFVASWIAHAEDNNSRMKWVLMEFPSDKIFYPLFPGSVYPWEGLPETISIIGFVSPKLYANIENKTRVEYFYSSDGTSLDGFFSTSKPYWFTRIVVDAKPSLLTEDFYISSFPSVKITFASWMNNYIYIAFILWFMLVAFITSIIAQRLLFSPENRPKLLSIFLFNCLSFIGTIIGSLVLLKEKRLKFIILTTLIFLIINALLFCLFGSLFWFDTFDTLENLFKFLKVDIWWSWY